MAEPSQDDVPEWAEEVPDWAVEVEESEPAETAPIRAEAPSPGPQPVPPAPPMGPILGGVPLNPEWWRSNLGAVGRQALSGFLKQGSDEAAGALAGAATDVLPGARYRMLDGTERPVSGRGDIYRAVRDTERERLRIAEAQHPVTSFLANMAGDLGSDAVLRALGVPVTSNAYQAAVGGLSGLLGNDAELTGEGRTPASMASAGASTAVGAGLGALAPVVGRQAMRAAPGLAARARQALEDRAIAQGRRVLLSGADALAGNKELRADSVREALESDAIRMFGTTQDAYRNLEALVAEREIIYSDILNRLEAAGVQGPEAKAIADELMGRYQKALDVSGADESIPNIYKSEAEAVQRRPRPGFVMGEGGGTTGARGLALGLNQAEGIKRDLQDKARWERLRETGLDRAKQEASRVFRRAIEDTIEAAGEAAPPGSEVAQLAEEFLPVKQQLSRTLDARNAAERGATAAAKRRGFSLTDNIHGAAAAAATGNPFYAVAAGMGNNLLRTRGTSTFARGAYDASKAVGAFGRWAATEPDTAQTLASVGSGLASRQATSSDWLQNLVSAQPEAMGRYGPMLSAAAARGPEDLAQAHYVLSQTDPEYAAQVQRAAEAAQQ